MQPEIPGMNLKGFLTLIPTYPLIIMEESHPLIYIYTFPIQEVSQIGLYKVFGSPEAFLAKCLGSI